MRLKTTTTTTTTTATNTSYLLESSESDSKIIDDKDEKEEHDFFKLLPMVIWGEIMSFLDVPSLGASGCVSKQMNQVATSPSAWYPSLNCLLRVLLLSARSTKNDDDNNNNNNNNNNNDDDDDDDHDGVTELLAKVQKDIHTITTGTGTGSAAEKAVQRIMRTFCGQEYCFAMIMQDHRHEFAQTFNARYSWSSSSHHHLGWIEQREHWDLLLENPREYYKSFGSLALWAFVSYNMELARICHCTDCDSWCLFDCNCDVGCGGTIGTSGTQYIEHCIFRRFQPDHHHHVMGNGGSGSRSFKMIRLFRTPPEECQPRHQKLFCRHFADLNHMLDGGTDEELSRCIKQWERLTSQSDTS